MPVPSAISSLSQTAGNNSPPGSESPTSADDYLRQYSAFIAMLRDGVGFSVPVQLASAATTSIGAQNAMFVEITGTTTITSFGTTYNGPRFLRFTGALTLTHNATTLSLPGAANITTAAGDTAIAIPNQGGNGWNVVQFQRAYGAFNATRADVASAATVDLSSVADDINITGTTTISAFTVVIGRVVRVRFNASLTLTNGASLVTNTSADIVTQAGDSCLLRATAANTVEVVGYTRAVPVGSSSASLSGTSTDITGIPAHARKINIAFSAVGGSSTGKLAIQLGSTTFPANGHAYNSSNTATSNNASSGDRFVVCQNAMSNLNISGGVTLTRVGTSNTWTAFGLTSSTGAAAVPTMFNGQVTSLTGALDRIRITSSTGTETLSGTAGITWS
jgi:hypothetical protein